MGIMKIKEVALTGEEIYSPVSIGQTTYWLPRNWEIALCKNKGQTPETQECQVTYISIMQNSKKEWTKKFRVSKITNGKRIDIQRNYNFNDIGREIFFSQKEADDSLYDLVSVER